MKKILTFILSAVMLFSLTVTPASAIDIAEVKTAVTGVLYKALAFVFGEFCADLAYGGSSLKAENSTRCKDFSEQTLAELKEEIR